ncbi:LemA family protein [Hyphococcus sp.]|uniref:LemA family protein n=1 Tax=Hyphococcus sp. TaxID=2038636 RepID=UPI0035C6E45A
MNAGLLIIGLIVLLGVALAILYNLLVRRRQMARNGWADIDVQLKRRADLIPQLVATVQGYANHERKLFEDVIEKRNAALAAGDDPAARGEAESALSQPVRRMIAVAEDYPDLKASGNFLELQKELADTEDKIEMARRFYNGAVRELNTLIESFPVNMAAGPLGFSKRDYFEIETADRAVPEVRLGA